MQKQEYLALVMHFRSLEQYPIWSVQAKIN